MTRRQSVIAREYEEAGFDVPVHHGLAWTVLDKSARDDVPGRSRALPLGSYCYLAIRKTAHQPGWGRGERCGVEGMGRTASARRRGEVRWTPP